MGSYLYCIASFTNRRALALCVKAAACRRDVHLAAGPEGSVTLSPAQLSMLLEGIDCRAPLRTDRPTCAG